LRSGFLSRRLHVECRLDGLGRPDFLKWEKSNFSGLLSPHVPGLTFHAVLKNSAAMQMLYVKNAPRCIKHFMQTNRAPRAAGDL
jgi:hypothetical protein